MILAVAATQIEMNPFLLLKPGQNNGCLSFLSGVGPVETAVRLTRFLLHTERPFTAVVNFGVGGAYVQPAGMPSPSLLDICLAESEVLGDFGICFPERFEYFSEELAGQTLFPLDAALLEDAVRILQSQKHPFHTGPFVTVNSASGSGSRGEMLRRCWMGLCENMEGAAVARVCNEFRLPFLEIRAISNYVEDRNVQNWRLAEACAVAAETAALLVQELK